MNNNNNKNKIAGLIIGSVIVVILVISLVYYNTQHTSKTKTISTSKITPSRSPVVQINNTIVQTRYLKPYGYYLTNLKGDTLYTYSADTTNHSNCSGSCLSIWPAYIDNGSINNLPANFSVFKNTSIDKYQYAFKGMPLYFYTGDTKAGEVNGNNVAGFKVATI